MPHEHLVQLRWSDPDSLGHVNHARALSLLEDARLAMIADLPEPTGVILARLGVDHLRQLYHRIDERLTVSTTVTRIGTKSFAVRHELAQDGQVAIRVLAVCVHFDFTTDTSRAMTDDERGHWTTFAQD